MSLIAKDALSASTTIFDMAVRERALPAGFHNRGLLWKLLYSLTFLIHWPDSVAVLPFRATGVGLFRQCSAVLPLRATGVCLFRQCSIVQSMSHSFVPLILGMSFYRAAWQYTVISACCGGSSDILILFDTATLPAEPQIWGRRELLGAFFCNVL